VNGLRRVAVSLLGPVALAGAGPAFGQVAPNAAWRTLRTPHFSVHFTPPLEATARRAAAAAETAYVRLAARLHPPRGPIDIVVADNVDYANGFTFQSPTNRIVVYVHPPLDVPSLRYYDDPLALVLTHELTHVFHLDRTRGWWRTAQRVFGRSPVFFPNLYDPGWMIEGLATYFESEITGSGRVAGTYERMLVDATGVDGGLLPFDRWSLATTRYPGGDIAYGFGGLFFEHLSETRGRDRVADFIERSSGMPIPFVLGRPARRAFGMSLSAAWRAWRDSVAAHAPPAALPLAGWRDLWHGAAMIVAPRWLDSTTLLYTANDWVESPAAYRAGLGGQIERLGRRNSRDPNTVLPDGALLFSQLDYTDPYHVRSDLYVERNGHERRLTHGARLAQPDARRSDGAIVAVQFVPATMVLVRVSADGRTVTPLTLASPDTQWADPRWSPRGDRIVATRWTRGGYTDVVILDTLGRVVRALTHDRAIDGPASWTPDGRGVVFASDRTGRSELYWAPASGEREPRRVSHGGVGVFFPELSPDGRWLAAVRYDAGGWHLGIAPFDTTGAESVPVAASFDGPELPPAAQDAGSVRPYSPWRSLLPRYWLPLIDRTAAGTYAVGGFTSGMDVVGRHAYYVQALLDPRAGEHTFTASYRYAGLGQPVVGADADQDWDRAAIVDTTGAVVGHLVRRTRTLALTFTMSRPRIRTNAFWSVGGELEMRHYTSEPAPLLGRLVDAQYFRSSPRYWNLVASTGWSNAQRPPRAISLEDGLAIGVTGRLKWLEGRGGEAVSRSVTAVASAYKSLDLGGYAHHVVAVRVAAGFANGADPGEYDVGGSSGTASVILPGISIGSHRTFPVRGFPGGAESGSRALTGSVEYRLPLVAPHRGLGLWPIFLDRTSLAVFADGGAAWGPGEALRFDRALGAVGAELGLDAGVPYDTPYRLRVGVAVPVSNRVRGAAAPVSVFFQLGYEF
jgi:hypothetical protein